MKIFKALFASVLMTLSGAAASAVNVEFSDVSNFKDVRAGAKNSIKFIENLKADLTYTFKKNLDDMPDDLFVNVTFLDIDLAGVAAAKLPYQSRYIRETDYPRMKFLIEIKDKSGNVILSQVQNIKEKAIEHTLADKRKLADGETLYLEKKLINQYCQEILIPSLKILDNV